MKTLKVIHPAIHFLAGVSGGQCGVTLSLLSVPAVQGVGGHLSISVQSDRGSDRKRIAHAASFFGRYLIVMVITVHHPGAHLSWSSVLQAQSPSILALVLIWAAFLPKVLVSVPANSPLRRNGPTPCISAPHKCFPHKENFFKNIETVPILSCHHFGSAGTSTKRPKVYTFATGK